MQAQDEGANKVISEINNDLTSGAAELTLKLLQQLSIYSGTLNTLPRPECQKRLSNLTNQVKHLRPCMAPLHNTINDFQSLSAAIEADNSGTYTAKIQSLCKDLHQQARQRQIGLIEQATKALSHASSAITISRSSCISRILCGLEKRPFTCIVLESRPGNEGQVLAMELAEANIKVDYIIDAAIANHIQSADIAIVGADSILQDGSVVNKCGTSLLALAAKHYQVPFYVIADSSKCAPWDREGLVKEAMPLAELNAPDSPLIQAHNYYFDITDRELISGYITESEVYQHWPWNE